MPTLSVVSMMRIEATFGTMCRAMILAWLMSSYKRRVPWRIVAAGVTLQFLLALVTLLASGWRYSGKATPPITVGVGALSGFLSGAAQIGGVPAIVYWLGFLWCALLALLATKAGRKVGQSSAMRWFEGAMGVGFFGLAGRLALARNI